MTDEELNETVLNSEEDALLEMFNPSKDYERISKLNSNAKEKLKNSLDKSVRAYVDGIKTIIRENGYEYLKKEDIV